MGRMLSLGVKIEDNWPEEKKIAAVLCPTSAQAAKCINKYISIMERGRKGLDEGTPLDHLGYRNPSIAIVERGYNPNDSNSTFSLSSIDSDFLNSSVEE